MLMWRPRKFCLMEERNHLNFLRDRISVAPVGAQVPDESIAFARPGFGR